MSAESCSELKDLFENELASKLEDKFTMMRGLLNHLIEKQDKETCTLEIKSGVGGEESSLFVNELGEYFENLTMRCTWKIEALEKSTQHVRYLIEGKGSQSLLLQEAGVHRIQRVPVTDSYGRVHTSAVAVAVLPYINRSEVVVDKDDCEIRYMRSSGPGGQNANMANSAVRIIHKPSGVSVFCQEYRTASENQTHGLNILSKKINSLEAKTTNQEVSNTRKSHMLHGDRSEKIRTYNYPRNEVTNHILSLRYVDVSKYLKGTYFLESSLFYLLDKMQKLFKDVD